MGLVVCAASHLNRLALHLQASYSSSEAAVLLCISLASAITTGYHSSG